MPGVKCQGSARMGGASPEELSASCRVQPLGSSAAPHKGPFVSRGVRGRGGCSWSPGGRLRGEEVVSLLTLVLGTNSATELTFPSLVLLLDMSGGAGPGDRPGQGLAVRIGVTLCWVSGCGGFPGGSGGKGSACSAGDLASIPGLGRSPGEGIGFPLRYPWASLPGCECL